ncbi:MAG: hypothetical protein FJZ01_28625, partial [Candidatus Sericytochromatia bacterium]|nr:hypothetical protein [Candidatus Tanganyikabacteria bacterium]
MRILLIGGTGFISGEIARLAVGAGHAVTLFHRHAASGGALPALAGDAERLPEHAAALREIAPDLVVHSVCHSEQHARDLLAVFAGTDARLLVLGSQDCYAAFQDTARGRDTADFPIGEDDPLTPIRHYYRDRIPG